MRTICLGRVIDSAGVVWRVLVVVCLVATVIAATGCRSVPYRLAAAIENGDLQAVRSIVGKPWRRLDFTEAYEDGWPPLHCTAYAGETEIARYLIGQGADVNSVAAHGATPLILAAEQGDAAMVSLLLRSGADPSKRNVLLGLTPLHMVAFHGASSRGSRADVVRLLLAAGAPVDARSDRGGKTPLLYACLRGRTEVAAELIGAGACVAPDGTAGNALQYAAASGNVETAQLIIEHGLDVNTAMEDGWTALHSTVGSKFRVDMCHYLLGVGANPNARTDSGETPLMCVFTEELECCGDLEDALEIVRALLEAETDVSIRNNKGETALVLAAKYRFMRAVRLIREAELKQTPGLPLDPRVNERLLEIPILDQDALECLAPLPVVDDGKWEPKVRLGGKQPRIPRRRRALLPADDRVLRLPGTCRFGAEVRTAALRTRAGGDPAGWQQWGISTYGVDAYEQMLADPLMTRETWTVHFEHVRRASVDQLANRVGAELRRLGWTYARELRPYELSTQPQPVRDGKAVPKERLTSEQRDRPGAVYQQGDRLVSFLCGTTGEHVSLQFRLLGLLPEELLGYDYDAKWSSVWDTLGAAGE